MSTNTIYVHQQTADIATQTYAAFLEWAAAA